MAIILVAHRPSTIAHADTIYVIDRGRIAAKGSFDELRGNSNIFNHIVHEKVSSGKEA